MTLSGTSPTLSVSITCATAAELPYARDTSGRYDQPRAAPKSVTRLTPPSFSTVGTGIVADGVSALEHEPTTFRRELCSAVRGVSVEHHGTPQGNGRLGT